MTPWLPPTPRRSTLGMVLLALLMEAPMHPYRMQQMIKERGQDQLVNVAQRNSVYQALDRLVRDGLARPVGTVRDGGRPERTDYEITDDGRATMRRLADRHAADAGPGVPRVPGRAGVHRDPAAARGPGDALPGGSPPWRRSWPRSPPRRRPACPGCS